MDTLLACKYPCAVLRPYVPAKLENMLRDVRTAWFKAGKRLQLDFVGTELVDMRPVAAYPAQCRTAEVAAGHATCE